MCYSSDKIIQQRISSTTLCSLYEIEADSTAGVNSHIYFVKCLPVLSSLILINPRRATPNIFPVNEFN